MSPKEKPLVIEISKFTNNSVALRNRHLNSANPILDIKRPYI